MKHKILFVAVLLMLFIGEILGLGYYLSHVHKGRIVDTICAILIVFFCIALIVVFSKLYDNAYHIF